MQVHIDPGMKDGHKITSRGEGDQRPGIEPGDVIFVIDEKEHDVYTRKGHDLHINIVSQV